MYDRTRLVVCFKTLYFEFLLFCSLLVVILLRGFDNAVLEFRHDQCSEEKYRRT